MLVSVNCGLRDVPVRGLIMTLKSQRVYNFEMLSFENVQAGRLAFNIGLKQASESNKINIRQADI